MTNGYRPTITKLPDEEQSPGPGIEQHCARLQRQKRMIGLQQKIASTKTGFILVRVMDGIPVRWDDVTLTVRNEKQISL